MLSKKDLSNILAASSMETLLSVAADRGTLIDGKVNLSGCTVKFDHRFLDLSRFVFDDTNLSGSRFSSCTAEGAHFKGCNFKDVRFSCEGVNKATMDGAIFTRCSLKGTYFGPATLSLNGVIFENSKFKDVTFMYGALSKSKFIDCSLSDVYFRKGDLTASVFEKCILERVSFEGANLDNVEFKGSKFLDISHWGEPDFSKAIIEESIKYSFGIIKKPYDSILDAIASGHFSKKEIEYLEDFSKDIKDCFADAPEAMLLYEEFKDYMPLSLFTKLIKFLKS